MMTGKPSFAQSQEMVFPEHCNHYGTLFAGQALALLSKAAFVAAAQCAQQSVVMAAVSGVQFLRPVPQGSLLTLRAWVTRVGSSSMSVCVQGSSAPLAQSPAALTVVLEGLFEMVAVDAAGKPQSIAPSLVVDGVFPT